MMRQSHTNFCKIKNIYTRSYYVSKQLNSCTPLSELIIEEEERERGITDRDISKTKRECFKPLDGLAESRNSSVVEALICSQHIHKRFLNFQPFTICTSHSSPALFFQT